MGSFARNPLNAYPVVRHDSLSRFLDERTAIAVGAVRHESSIVSERWGSSIQNNTGPNHERSGPVNASRSRYFINITFRVVLNSPAVICTKYMPVGKLIPRASFPSHSMV